MSGGPGNWRASVQAGMFLRSFLLQACWSFERMQGLGLAYCLEPWLKRLYGAENRRLAEALARHMRYFNTQPYMAAFVLGVVARLEHSAAAQPEAAAGIHARIDTLRASMGAALAGLGDAFFWGALRPACAALAGALALALVCAGLPVSCAAFVAAGGYAAAFNTPALWVRWKGLSLGYEMGEAVVVELQRWDWQAKLFVLRKSGFLIALGLCAWLVTGQGGGGARILSRVLLFSGCLAMRWTRLSLPRAYALLVLWNLAGALIP